LSFAALFDPNQSVGVMVVAVQTLQQSDTLARNHLACCGCHTNATNATNANTTATIDAAITK
jgi:hypothetical protein